jgi:hypothetical protein
VRTRAARLAGGVDDCLKVFFWYAARRFLRNIDGILA